MTTKTIVLVAALLGGLAGVAHAYPQYQLSRDTACSSCHLAPEGGGILNENGLASAEANSQFGTNPDFFYGKANLPTWLTLGGDLRAAAGYDQTPTKDPVAFPMQAEIYGHAQFGQFSAYVVAGVRDPQNDNTAETLLWSREHYLMWQSNPGGTDGIYVRVGRFMPIFGLRFAEHPDYTRQFGGTQLYGETYGAAMEIVTAGYEAHLTGFIKDPLLDTTEHANGGAFYGEKRITPVFSLGLEGRYAITNDDRKWNYGATAKYYVAPAELLFQLEVQGINQRVFSQGTLAGGTDRQLVGYLMVTKFLGNAFMADLGFGHYSEDVEVEGLDRDALDLNIHWFATSHLELALDNRLEVLGLGASNTNAGGPTGAYSLLMVHYRL